MGQLSGSCLAAVRQLASSCAAAAWPETVSGSFAASSRFARQLPCNCQAAAKQFRGNCLAGRGFDCCWALFVVLSML